MGNIRGRLDRLEHSQRAAPCRDPFHTPARTHPGGALRAFDERQAVAVLAPDWDGRQPQCPTCGGCQYGIAIATYDGYAGLTGADTPA